MFEKSKTNNNVMDWMRNTNLYIKLPQLRGKHLSRRFELAKMIDSLQLAELESENPALQLKPEPLNIAPKATLVQVPLDQW